MKTFYVVTVGKDPFDSYARSSPEGALAAAGPDYGALLRLYEVKATDTGAARLPAIYKGTHGNLLATSVYACDDNDTLASWAWQRGL